MTEPKIYRYIVRYDGGTAPNPFDGFCTLAICKPAIRRKAEVGDWIIGFRSQQRGRVIYAMQVNEAISFDEYWNDPRFRSRRPDVLTTPTDNIYRSRAIAPDGSMVMEQVNNEVHKPEASSRDLSGNRVLIARRFWYFGDRSPLIDDTLSHLSPVTQGHVVHKHRKVADIENLQTWLSGFNTGVLGTPVDRAVGAASTAEDDPVRRNESKVVRTKDCRR